MSAAIAGMNELINSLPQSDKSFAVAKEGLDYDISKEKYDHLGKITFADIKAFHDRELSGKPYTYCVVASDKKIKTEDLQKIGQVKALSLEELFGY